MIAPVSKDFTSVWKDDTDYKETSVDSGTFRYARVTCKTTNTYDDPSPFLEMTVVTLPEKDIL